MKAEKDVWNFLKATFSALSLIVSPGHVTSSHVTSSHLTTNHVTWDFGMCPNGCTCTLTFSHVLSRSLRTVNCTELDLDLPPMNISVDSERIILSGNRLLTGSLALLRDVTSLAELTIVGCHVRSLEGLVLGGHDWTLASRVLNADRNLLTQLHDRSFINLAELEFLILSNNRIETIHGNAFSDLTRLTFLDLSGNRLTTLTDARWLGHVSHVTCVNLSGNSIHVIQGQAFRSLTNLVTLDLSRNRIRQVDDDAFSGLDRLRHLSLSDNSLPVVPTAAILKLNRLAKLTLSGNSFAEIGFDNFRSISTLTSLELNRMSDLQLVERWAFRNMTSLERLELRQNRRLKYIDHEAFEGLPRLRELDLEGSGLEGVDEDLIKNVPSLRRLNLRSNPLVCDCVLSWLVRKLAASNETELAAQTETETETGIETEGKIETETGIEIESKTEFETETETETEIVTETKTRIKTETESGIETETRLETETRIETETESGFVGLSVTDARCSRPAALKNTPMAEVALDQITGFCGPRILGLFSPEVQVPMTDPTRLHCRAVGIPRPRTFWIPQSSRNPLSSFSPFSSSSSSFSSSEKRIRQRSALEQRPEVLQIESTLTDDQGRYTCRAISSEGQTDRTTFIHVRPLEAAIIVLRMTSNSITVTWRGTDHVPQSRDYYAIAYRKLLLSAANFTDDDDDVITVVAIKHYMRSFTASELPPEVDFEFCVGIRRPPTNHFRSINCTVASTRNRKFVESGLRRVGAYVIVVMVTVCGAILCFGSTVVCSTKAIDRNKRAIIQEAPSVDDRMSEMFLSSLEGGGGSNMASSEIYENEAAESAIFDDADLDEIRKTACLRSS